MLPHSVITVSIATAYFTRMSEHARDGDLDRVRDDLSSAVRGVALILVLAAAVLVVVAYPFAAVFQPGDSTSVSALGNVIIAFAIGLVGFSILFVVQRTFYALGDTRTPFFFTLVPGDRLLARRARAASLLPVEWIAVGVALVDDDRQRPPSSSSPSCCCAGSSAGSTGDASPSASGATSRRSSSRSSPASASSSRSAAPTDGGFAIGDRVGAIVSMAVIGS